MSYGLKHAYNVKTRGLYSRGNWTCMITAVLSSVVHTNLPGMKSDLIKIVWIKFVFRFKSANLFLCLWCVIWCMYCTIDGNMLILTLPLQHHKTRLPGLRFRGVKHVFQCGGDNDCRRHMQTMKVVKNEIEVGQEESGNTVQRQCILSVVDVSSWILHNPVKVPQNGCRQSATSQFEQQKMSDNKSSLNCVSTALKRFDILYVTMTTKAFVALWQIQGKPK